MIIFLGVLLNNLPSVDFINNPVLFFTFLKNLPKKHLLVGGLNPFEKY